MKNFKSTLTALTMGIVGFGAISISADELQEKHVMVEIHKLSDSNTTVDLNVNGEAHVFSLPDLEIGDIKDIVTESGNSISVSKTESGITININGEEFNLPSMGGDMSAHIMKGGMPLHTMNDGIQVIGDLTPEQVAIIDDAFKAAGVEKKVHFTQGHEMKFIRLDGDHDGSFDIKIDELSKMDWITNDGTNVKIIKLGHGDSELHMESKIIIIETDEENH